MSWVWLWERRLSHPAQTTSRSEMRSLRSRLVLLLQRTQFSTVPYIPNSSSMQYMRCSTTDFPTTTIAVTLQVHGQVSLTSSPTAGLCTGTTTLSTRVIIPVHFQQTKTRFSHLQMTRYGKLFVPHGCCLRILITYLTSAMRRRSSLRLRPSA